MMELEAKRPIPEKNWLIKCVSAVITCVHALSAILLVVSAFSVLYYYILIMFGNLPSPLQILQLNYSIYVLGGSTVFLFLYSAKIQERIETWLGIREIQKTD
jgi:hypothetical protein